MAPNPKTKNVRLLVTIPEDMKQDLEKLADRMSNDLMQNISLAQLARMGFQRILTEYGVRDKEEANQTKKQIS